MNVSKEEQNVLEDKDLETPLESQESENANNLNKKAPVKKMTVKKRAAKKSIEEEAIIQIKDIDETEQDISVLPAENVLSESDQEAPAEKPEPGETEQKIVFMTENLQNESFFKVSDHKKDVFTENAKKDGILEHMQVAVKDKAEKEDKKKKKRKLDATKSTLCKLVKKDYLKKHVKEYQDLIIDPKYICATCGRAAHHKKSICKPQKIKS